MSEEYRLLTELLKGGMLMMESFPCHGMAALCHGRGKTAREILKIIGGKQMIKNLSKKVSWLLVFMMVFSILVIPNTAEASATIDNTKAGSYIQATATGLSAESYIRVTTPGGTNPYTGIAYKAVVRGNILLTFPVGTNLASVPVTLYANGYNFTLNGVTVMNGNSASFTLDLTKENTATLDVPTATYESGTYVITGAKAGDTIQVTTSINVSNPQSWLAGTYNQPGYPATPPATNPSTAKVTNALTGFATLTPVTFTVPKGTTAMKVLDDYGKSFNMNITGISSGYISKMGVKPYQQIGEFDINSYSGWMYTVDEGSGWYFPNVGASAKTLTNNTTMIWHFTMAYGADVGAPWGAPAGTPGMPASFNMDRALISDIGSIVPQWANSERQIK